MCNVLTIASVYFVDHTKIPSLLPLEPFTVFQVAGAVMTSYITLILVFVVAGILIVACLFLLNLTVAIGTVNGLIFYANIVQANCHVFFPPGDETRPLEVFIAWLILDFGIETCSYEGMTT